MPEKNNEILFAALKFIEAFIKKIVVFPEYMEWYLRITDDGEGPIKTELSGTMKSGLTVTFNVVDNTQLSLAQHRQLLSNSLTYLFCFVAILYCVFDGSAHT